MDKEPKPKRELTNEQLEALKARLIKAREAKMSKDKASYDVNKDKIKEDGLKKRTMNKVKALMSKGAINDEELKEILPKQIPIANVVNEIVKEIPFDKPLPKKRVPKAKPIEQPAVIPFDEPLPEPRGTGWKGPRSAPIDIPIKPEKNRFLKVVYYKEPSKKVMKRLQKIQESSSDSDSSSSDSETEFQHAPPQAIKKQIKSNKAVVADEDQYYQALVKKFYGC